MFKGLLVEKHDQGEGEKPKFTATVKGLSEDDLPAGDVTLDVAYSSFNYKDGLVTLGLGGLSEDFWRQVHASRAWFIGRPIRRTFRTATCRCISCAGRARFRPLVNAVPSDR